MRRGAASPGLAVAATLGFAQSCRNDPFLDLHTRVSFSGPAGETGLLGMAFHPKWQQIRSKRQSRTRAGSLRRSSLPSSAPAAVRARAYLHANCAFCHRPGSSGQGSVDLRFSTTFAGTRICDASPENGDFGIAGARLFAPPEQRREAALCACRNTTTKELGARAAAVAKKRDVSLVEGFAGARKHPSALAAGARARRVGEGVPTRSRRGQAR